MKRKLGVIVLIIATLLLAGCGKTQQTNNNNLGTRENPYKIGDTVVIKDLYESDGRFAWINIPFTLTFTVNDIMTKEEIQEMVQNADPSLYIDVCPAIDFTFKIEGNYSDAINLYSLFPTSVLTDTMVELYSRKASSDVQTGAAMMGDCYTDIEYNLYRNLDLDEALEANLKYFVIKYYDKGLKEHSIYIDLETSEEIK